MTLTTYQFLAATLLLVLTSGAVATFSVVLVSEYRDGRRVGLTRERSFNKAVALVILACTIILVMDTRLLLKVTETEFTRLCQNEGAKK